MRRDDSGRFIGSSDDFMQLEITDKMDGYEIDTTHGTVFLPIDACGEWDAMESSGRDFFADYVECDKDGIQSIEKITGYFGRYSAPGYMDCTEWTFGTNKRALARDVRAMHGSAD